VLIIIELYKNLPNIIYIASKEFLQHSKNSFSLLKTNLLDLIAQLYLFLNLILIIVAGSAAHNKNTTLNTEISSDIVVSGLGELKEMLYGYYSPFLIISTLVLLVALIGAAVMTKNSNK
jgi:NADH:ubiquinone oxidoreductase subunit 6 (subunit J)